MLQALFIFRAHVLVGKCLSGQMTWANVFLGKCPSGQMSSGQMSFWANVLLGKCPSGQMQTSSGQMFFWANVFLGKRLLDKICIGKCPSGQISFWANVFWADVFSANVVLGKCLWANVSRQMSYGQMSCHRYECTSLLKTILYDFVSRGRLLRETVKINRFIP
jgi:hypothetical protein